MAVRDISTTIDNPPDMDSDVCGEPFDIMVEVREVEECGLEGCFGDDEGVHFRSCVHLHEA